MYKSATRQFVIFLKRASARTVIESGLNRSVDCAQSMLIMSHIKYVCT